MDEDRLDRCVEWLREKGHYAAYEAVERWITMEKLKPHVHVMEQEEAVT
jgi:hypothetical protein